ncbi:TolC family protein [Mucilaginibacter sp. Bleaf8]|uniref:TolC family protein n=1 Tax=Mucilaginibacter sp. Bleaf8 TaxID=2834430 RepID=UPI001BD05A49|nr:TolC family protein [Mucilaginibacter sp. Bleaf8]MBS7566950.1 TolC family protein [Mucilaginibacter sp. Bleaf8]
MASLRGFAQYNLPLTDAIDSALKRSLLIKQAENNVALAIEDLKQARYNKLPSFAASPQASINWGRSLDVSTYSFINQRVSLINGSISTQFTLFQGGQLRQQVLENKLILEAGKSAVTKVKYDLILNVATTYTSALASEDMLQTAKQQLRLAQLTEENVRKSFDAGNKSEADLAQVQAQVIKVELNIADLQNQLDVALLTLRQLTEMPNVTFLLSRPDTALSKLKSTSVDSVILIRKAIENNPDINIARRNLAIRQQRIKRAKSAYYPTVSLFGSAGTNYSDARTLLTGSRQTGFDTIGTVNGTNQSVLTPAYRNNYSGYPLIRQFADNFYQSVGVSLQIPIFSKLSNRINVTKAKLAYIDAQFVEQLAVSNFIKIFNQAITDIKFAEKRLRASEKNLKATEKVLLVSDKRYKAGLIGAIEYNTVLSDFNQAQLDLIQAKYVFLFRLKIIDYYSGNMLAF